MPLDTEFSNFLYDIFGPPPYSDFFIAGGCVRKLWIQQDWKSADIDIFLKSEADLLKISCEIKSKLSATKNILLRKVMNTENAKTFILFSTALNKEIKLQFISKKYYQTFRDLWSDFDFTICQFYTDGVYLYASNDALEDEKKKILRLVKNNKNCLVRRFIKYVAYGYTPTYEIYKELENQLKDETTIKAWTDDEY